MKNHTPVFINLLAIARYDHTPDYPIQFMTIGNLSYSNPEEALERKGEFSSTMVFAKGQRFEGVYHTPYGEMDMAVFTKEAACRFGRTEGNIHLKYQLNIQGSYASINELHLEYKAEQGNPGKKKGN